MVAETKAELRKLLQAGFGFDPEISVAQRLLQASIVERLVLYYDKEIRRSAARRMQNGIDIDTAFR
eukprot:355941-Heterocapsa_arctica.AAC.1